MIKRVLMCSWFSQSLCTQALAMWGFEASSHWLRFPRRWDFRSEIRLSTGNQIMSTSLEDDTRYFDFALRIACSLADGHHHGTWQYCTSNSNKRATQRASLIQRMRNVLFNIYTSPSFSFSRLFSLFSKLLFAVSDGWWGHWTGHFTVINIREWQWRSCSIVCHLIKVEYDAKVCIRNKSSWQLAITRDNLHASKLDDCVRVANCGKRFYNLKS